MPENISKRERIRKYGEVFTPPEVVSAMCDMLEEESHGAFAIEKTFLEPTCGEGVFILEILRRKFAGCRTREDYRAAIESVYGFEVQADNVAVCIENVTALCREYFRPTKEDLQMISDHVILCDGLKVMRMMARMNERKAQEPVEPLRINHDTKWQRDTECICGECSGSFYRLKVNFCPWCGQAVKWDAAD